MEGSGEWEAVGKGSRSAELRPGQGGVLVTFGFLIVWATGIVGRTRFL